MSLFFGIRNRSGTFNHIEEHQAISEHSEQDNGPSNRRPKAILAAIAGVAGLGLGYLYVGRPRLAFIPFLAVFGTIAVAGWTRLILEPSGLYVAYALVLLFFLASIIHPAIVAYKLNELAARPFNRGWIYTVWIVVFGIFGTLIGENRASLFGFEPFRIPSSSMAPTIQRNDLIMVDTWRFRHTNPEINDLVVFDLPDNSGTKYQFRIVGTPGDTIQIREDVLIRNGVAILEEFIEVSEGRAGIMSNFGPMDVPDDHFLVLGDNRHNARDSRFLGPIHRDLLHGRVEYRWFASDDGISWARFPERLTANE